MAQLPKLTFPVALLSFQILLLGLFAGYVDYETNVSLAKTHAFYSEFQDVHAMAFVGAGFLMSFLKKYAFSAMSYNLLIASVSVQWATLLNAWIKQRVKNEIKLDIESLLTADFAAMTMVISFGVVLGKASRLQLLLIAICECIFHAINETIIIEYLHITDVGGSMVIHMFAAYFGLAVSAVLRTSKKNHKNEVSVYHSDVFSMIGTLFLWVFSPSFNSAALVQDPDRHNRAIINTFFALAASVVTTFCVSSAVNKNFKLNMVHIQNATLAGGVAVAASADLMIKPWGAILVGCLAAVISVLGYTYLTPFMNERLGIHDTCGVHNLHGMPGLFGGIIDVVATASIERSDYPNQDFENTYKRHASRSSSELAAYQAAAIFVTLGISIAGGAITGLIVKNVDETDEEYYYLDEKDFEVPTEDSNCNINGNKYNLEMTTSVSADRT